MKNFDKLFIENYRCEQKLWKILAEEHFLVKFQTLNLRFCRKKCNPLQISFYWFMCISGAPPNSFEVYCMLYCYSFSAVKTRSFEWLTHGKSLIKTKLNHLINRACFWVRSITKKEKHGNNSVKIHSELYSTWYMKVHSEQQNTWYIKVIWKIQYKFADAKINWLTWWYSSRFTRHCTLNISYRKRRHIFSALLFYKH